MKKIFTLWLMLQTVISSNAQSLKDSTVLHMSEQDLGLHLLQKSKNQKLAGYIFTGIAAVSCAALPFVFTNEIFNSMEGENVSGGGSVVLGILALGSTAASIGFISAGTKNSGKAEMLLRHKSANEPPGYELAMGMHYQKISMQQRMTGYTLLGTGVTLILVAPSLYHPEKGEASGKTSDLVTVCGLVSTCASLPFLISATKNKGRASVLLKKESIPFSYYSKPIGLNSVMLAISLGK
jgi:hypothetical protein